LKGAHSHFSGDRSTDQRRTATSRASLAARRTRARRRRRSSVGRCAR